MCGSGVTSLIIATSMPEFAKARIALSRPAPGPFTKTSQRRIPASRATFAASAEVSIKKASTAALFRAASAKLENSINAGRQALITVGHTFLQGGIPIVVDGQVIGAIGVSGAASAQQDEDIAIAGSKADIR